MVYLVGISEDSVKYKLFSSDGSATPSRLVSRRF